MSFLLFRAFLFSFFFFPVLSVAPKLSPQTPKTDYACPAVTGDLIKPCESIATTRQLVITVYDDVEAQKPIATTTIDGVGGGPRAAETTGVINVAYPIQVRFKQGEDAALVLGGRVLPTVGSATLLVASATPSPGGNGGGGASSTNQNPSTSAGGGGGGGSGRGIPMGLVVGVILVAAVGVAVAAIVAAMRVVRKRRREQGLPASAQQAAAMRAADVERRSQRTAQQRMAQQQQQQQQTGVEMFPPHGIPPDHRQRKLSVQHHGTATSSRVELQGNII